MTIKEVAFKHEGLAMKAWSLASMMAAVNEALYRGDCDASTYEGAFHQLVVTACEVSCEARELIDALFTTMRESGVNQ